MTMYTICLGMKLRPDSLEDYQCAHDDLWPTVAEGMRHNNVSMMIYRSGDQLIVFATAPSEADWDASRKDPELEKWHTYMTQFLQTDEHGNIAFELLDKVFSFGDFT